MNKWVFSLLCTACALSLCGIASAAPYELSYGGRLTESSGRPVSGSATLRVSFFRSATGSDQVAVSIPDFTNVALEDGLFQVVLSLSLADFHTLFNGTDATYIQVEDLNRSVIYPRQKFSAMPYALKVPVDGQSITFNANGQLALGNGVHTLKLPNTAGVASKVLKSDGAGGLVWADDLSGGGAGSVTSTEIQDGALTNDDISATAAIAISKIAGLGDAAAKNVGTTGSDVAAGNHTHTMSAVTDAGGLATKNAVASAEITDGSVTGADIASGAITNANISAGAAIDNSKIAGLGTAATKNVGSTGSDVAAGNHGHADATTGAAGFMSAGDKVRLNAAVVTTDTGTVSNTMIADGAINLAKLSATMCAANQILKMNAAGTALTCADPSAGSYAAKSADYTVAASDNDRLLEVTNQTTITLPPAATAGAGFRVTIKRSGSSLVRVMPDGSETIDGENVGVILVTPRASVLLVSSGASWAIGGKDGAYGRSSSFSDFTCGGAGDGCYSDATATGLGYAMTPSGKVIEYMWNSRGLRVWKETSGSKVLRPNGSDEWAMKLNTTGKGLSATAFTDWNSLEGRVCPPNVYIDDSNRFTTDNCLFYVAKPVQALNADGTDGINGLGGWVGERWYRGNVAACSSVGMRLPTLFETDTPVTSNSDFPTSNGNAVFAQSNGVPALYGLTWTASTAGNSTSNYWAWASGGVGSYLYSTAARVACVLP